MLCLKCGKKIPDGEDLCETCGTHTLNEAKKRKTSLIIGISIVSFLIVIGVIGAVILFDSNDKEKNNNNNNNNNNNSKVTVEFQENITENDETEMDKSTTNVIAFDEEEVMETIEEFLDSLSAKKYDDATDYIYPALIELYNDVYDIDIDKFLTLVTLTFFGDDMEKNNCKVIDTCEGDEKKFYEKFATGLEGYESYVTPDTYIEVEIEITYNDITKLGYAYIVVCAGSYYIYEIDNEDGLIEEQMRTEESTTEESTTEESTTEESTTEESTTEELTTEEPATEEPTTEEPTTEEDISNLTDIFDGPSYTINGECDGVIYTWNGYSIKLPEDWVQNNDIFLAPDGVTQIRMGEDFGRSNYKMREYYEYIIWGANETGFTISKKGYVYTDKLSGVYIEFDENVYDITEFLYERDTERVLYVAIMYMDAQSQSYNDAFNAIATLCYNE